MAPDPLIVRAVEQLGYRVTVGDVAAKAGIDVNLAERGLLALASDVGAHLQVTESGDVAYLFPKNLRGIIRNKYLQLRLKEWWEKVWRVLFYLIRISFGIVLLISLVLIFVSIFIIVIATNQNREDSNYNHSGNGWIFVPNYFWFDLDWFWFLSWDYETPYQRQQRSKSADGKRSQMSFLEAVFSFLFGDGDPNWNLEERRWQAIAAIIRKNKGAVVAEQIAPYLDNVGSGYANKFEEYMLPVLARFNGHPEVSPEGQLIYHFPDLQTTAKTNSPQEAVPSFLREYNWRFSQAKSSQLILAAGLGVLNFVSGLVLGSLLKGDIAEELGGLVAFVAWIYPVLIGYGTAFLVVPLVRYFWIQWRNSQIEARNQIRKKRANVLIKPRATLKKKIEFARQFAAEKVIDSQNLAYTTETDLLEQEIERIQRLNSGDEKN
ncbi:MAG: hypothetical protein NZ660_02170 [Oscillatoriaceae bacterium SKYG93]|nr:hypothetical protein [Oscillatoriaceae bacterium SKYG93]MDW8452245.1 hypothetical protein [Oscillatoriaceae cyanobacterium SKYGB_i_bin93]